MEDAQDRRIPRVVQGYHGTFLADRASYREFNRRTETRPRSDRQRFVVQVITLVANEVSWSFVCYLGEPRTERCFLLYS